MLSNALKQSLTMALVMAVLAGCSSTSTTEDTDASTDRSVSTGSAADSELSSRDTMDQDEAEELDTVFYFEFDSSVLSSDARATLTAHAAKLKAEPQEVRLEGHTDERGTREYNMALGERRANSVRDFLVMQGVNPALIETVSYGEEYPAVLGSTEAAYSKNRRVEMKYQ